VYQHNREGERAAIVSHILAEVGAAGTRPEFQAFARELADEHRSWWLSPSWRPQLREAMAMFARGWQAGYASGVKDVREHYRPGTSAAPPA